MKGVEETHASVPEMSTTKFGNIAREKYWKRGMKTSTEIFLKDNRFFVASAPEDGAASDWRHAARWSRLITAKTIVAKRLPRLKLVPLRVRGLLPAPETSRALRSAVPHEGASVAVSWRPRLWSIKVAVLVPVLACRQRGHWSATVLHPHEDAPSVTHHQTAGSTLACHYSRRRGTGHFVGCSSARDQSLAGSWASCLCPTARYSSAPGRPWRE